MPIIVPKVLISKKLTQGSNIASCKITIYYTGTISFEITADADAAVPTWGAVILTSGIETSHTFTVPGDQVMYRIGGSAGATIEAQTNSFGEWSAPGIQINFTYS